MLDVLVCIMPRIEPDSPTPGAGVIKAHLLQAGYKCEVVDFNIKLYNYLINKNLQDIFWKNSLIFSNQPSDPVNEEFEKFYQDHTELFDSWIEFIKQKNPKWVGMSLLSAFSCAASQKLSELIKDKLPHIKIVWGGTNIQHEGFHCLIDNGTIDAFIKGDGEKSIIELLQGNYDYPGINKVQDFDEIIPYDLSLPPDYDDIDWSEYHYVSVENPIYVTASRGCVRKCTFCNDWLIWPQYRYKSAKKVAKELDILKGKHNRTTFMFTDSLINGSISNFREILKELKTVKEKHDPKPFRWNSHFICRPKSQMPESDFKLMAESGCIGAVVGIESFSEKVRNHMGKKYTNDDIWYMIEMLTKYNIKTQILMLVGYVTETEQDHQINLQCIDKMFEDGFGYKMDPNYDYKRPLIRWQFGNSLLIDKEHALYSMYKDKGEFEYNTSMNWSYNDNDIATRLRRWKESIARIQKHDPSYTANPTTLRTIEITEERLRNPNGPKFWAE